MLCDYYMPSGSVSDPDPGIFADPDRIRPFFALITLL